jgi:putative toxin-antitoxin system antitoxin component (TIGR02293 family)
MTVYFSDSGTIGEHNVKRQIASLSARAAEVFGSREKAMRWLETPLPSLGNRTPLSLVSAPGGVSALEDTLGAIEHGVW